MVAYANSLSIKLSPQKKKKECTSSGCSKYQKMGRSQKVHLQGFNSYTVTRTPSGHERIRCLTMMLRNHF